MTSILLIFALATLTSAQNPSESCWYGKLCPFEESDAKEIPDTEVLFLDQMTWCQLECFNDLANGGTCQHFSVQKVGNRAPNCYLLATCADPSGSDECLGYDTCNSGPGDCDANNNCPMLTAANTGDDKISWQCDNGIKPYEQQIPEGETCFLSCNAWIADTGEPVMITSTCNAGVWDASVDLPAGLTVPALPSPMPKPDDLEATQVSCGCAPFEMEWENSATPGTFIDYDPNTLPGTAFICSEDPIDTTIPTDYKFTLSPTNECRLFCDSYHIVTMVCQNGAWTGEPELGAWCYQEPAAEDEMGPNP